MNRRSSTAALCLVLAACGNGASPGSDAGATGDAAAAGADAGVCGAAAENVAGCTAASTDFQPRKGVPAANGWPACVSDDGVYHLVGSSTPSSVARSIAAFDTMAGRLWRNPAPPTKDDFLAARDAYSVAEGVASRVARRQDLSYPEVPGSDKFACQSAGIPAQYPDRCAGPAKIKPLVDDAFVQGLAGTEPRVQAARIEAGILWFFHLSTLSEVWTCSFSNKNDCDSAAAYYTQVTARSQPAGYAACVAAVGPETHQRIYDALLAARCWRDFDSALPTVSGEELYRRASAQLRKAAERGIALVLRQRIGQVGCTTGDEQAAHVAFVKLLGGWLDHTASLRDAQAAATLKSYTSAPTADASAIAAAQTALDAAFPCP